MRDPTRHDTSGKQDDRVKHRPLIIALAITTIFNLATNARSKTLILIRLKRQALGRELMSSNGRAVLFHKRTSLRLLQIAG